MTELWKAAGAAAWGAVGFGGLLPYISESVQGRVEALCPGPRGIFVAAFPYYPGAMPGNLALYCRGADYHRVIARRLALVCKALEERHPGRRFVPGVDNSPLPEQRIAQMAGLGKRGLHNQLLIPNYGSYVFLGTILTDLPLETTKGTWTDGCTHCGACREACPTGALDDGFDRERCLSHITQKKGTLSPEEARLVEKHPYIWGCDLCQEACPCNQAAARSPLPEFHENLLCSLSAKDLEGLTNRQFQAGYEDRAFAWRGPGPLRRNLALQGSKQDKF